jgi:hypothetical protein
MSRSPRDYFKPFTVESLPAALRARNDQILAYMEREDEGVILGCDETEYISAVVDQFSVRIPKIDFDGFGQVRSFEREKSDMFIVSSSGSVKQGVRMDTFVFGLPFSGDKEFFKYKPSRAVFGSGSQFFFEENLLCFEVENTYGSDHGQVESSARGIVSRLKDQMEILTQELEGYNQITKTNVANHFRQRKQQILNRKNLQSAIKIPILKREAIPETAAIPTPEIRRRFEVKPTGNKGADAEPTLDDAVYKDILQTIHSVGRVFEKYPRIYKGRDEETLRDLLLLYLEPRYYNASVTAETFNAKGKTDIRISYQDSCAFIAECKFWKGEQGYLDAITQLHSYLTWRDSKAAVVLFVDRKDFSAVLNTINTVTSSHPNYLGFVHRSHDSWFDFRFHVNGDKDRDVKLAVLAFHLPSN